MTKDKKLQRARQREKRDHSMQALRSAALEVLEMLRDMPSLQMENLDTEKAILAAPDYNYFEKLMLHHIHKSAMKALELFNNTEGWRGCDIEDIRKLSAGLRDNVQWLINTAESILEDDTSWSDLLSKLLQDMHKGNDVTDEHGPVWLEYTFVDDEGERTALGEAAAQLERYGLVVRRKRMFTAAQMRRWPALEFQLEEESMEEKEVERAEATTAHYTAATSAAARQAPHLDSSFHAAALTDATCMADYDPEMLFPPQQQQQNLAVEVEQQQQQPREEGQPTSPGDVYTAMARDLAEYEQEIAAQQQRSSGQTAQSMPAGGGGRGYATVAAAAPASEDDYWGEESWAGGRGRGRSRGRGRGRGRGRAVQTTVQQQQQQPREEFPTLAQAQEIQQQPRQQQQQQRRQEDNPKGMALGAPSGWTPQFGSGAQPVERPRPAHVVTAGDFIANDAPLPESVLNAQPVLLRDHVIMHACTMRMTLESLFFPRGRNVNRNTEASRSGGSAFLTYVRTNPHITTYEKVVVARFKHILNGMVHFNTEGPQDVPEPDEDQDPAGSEYQSLLQQKMDKVMYIKSWTEQHLAHLMPDPPAGYTMEQQDNMDRLHKVATYMMEGLYTIERRARSPRLTLRGIVEDLMLTEPLAACVDAEEVEGTTAPSRYERCWALVQRTVDQMERDGLAVRHSNGMHIVNKMDSWEFRAANRFQ